jgi:hypothetical protein
LKVGECDSLSLVLPFSSFFPCFLIPFYLSISSSIYFSLSFFLSVLFLLCLLLTFFLRLFFMTVANFPRAEIAQCIAPGYGLDDGGFESWQRLWIFLFTTASRLSLGAHPAFYPKDPRDSFP